MNLGPLIGMFSGIKMKRTNTKQLEKIVKENIPKRYALGDSLYLTITKKGSASFGFRYQLNRKPEFIGLGAYCAVTNTLRTARTTASQYKAMVNRGINPRLHLENQKRERTAAFAIGEKERILRESTFKKIAFETIEFKQHEWTNEKTAAQWKSSLETYAFPVIGNMPVSEINRSHILKILTPIWFDKTETADRVRRRIEAVLRRAISKELRPSENPAVWRGSVAEHLPSPERIKNKRTPFHERHHQALHYRDLPSFIKQLMSMDGLAARALEFLILNASRTNEVLGATWDEINFEEQVWLIPARRMKGRIRHTVPLTMQSIDILKKLECFQMSAYIFPNVYTGKNLSQAGMSSVIRRMGKAGEITVHGFRSTFRDYVAEKTSFDGTIAELALAHKVRNKTQAAYQRGDLLEKRRELMQHWADYSYQINKPKIVKLRA